MEKFAKLTKIDKYNITNYLPTELVDLYLIVQNVEAKLGNNEIDQLIELIKRHNWVWLFIS